MTLNSKRFKDPTMGSVSGPSLKLFTGDGNASPVESTARTCPACGCDNRERASLSYSIDQWKLKSCAFCEFVYLENALAYDELVSSDFAWTVSHAVEESARRDSEPWVHWLSHTWKEWKRRHSKRDKARSLVQSYVGRGRVLDVGCSYGVLMSRLPESIVPYGIEIEERIAKMADEYAQGRGGRVVHADALSGLRQFDAGFFDGITMISFLEHEVQPTEVLAESRRVLRSGGRLVIKVPNYGCWNRRIRGNRWCGFRFPDHVNYFTPQSLKKMVHHVGLHVARCNLLDRLPISDSLWLVAEAN